MVKYTKAILFLIFIGLLVNPLTTQADFLVSTGNTFNYDIVKSLLEVTINDTSTYYIGCYIGTNVSVGSQFQIVVTSKTSSSVGYNQVYENWSVGGLASTPFFLVEALQYRFDTPNYLAVVFTQYWSVADEIYSEGIPIESLFFFDLNKNTFSAMEDALVIYIADLSALYTSDITIDHDSKFKDTNKEYQAEWYMKVHYHPDGFTDYTYSIGYKLVYSAINGVLLGARIKGYCIGTIGDTEVDLSFEQQVEQSGYDLKGFEIGEFKDAPGFGFVITISAILVLAVTVRKKRKTNKK
ncbi:MAG: choice-of-anchor S family protein [Candidatus Heimdallarchaeota archaeon]